MAKRAHDFRQTIGLNLLTKNTDLLESEISAPEKNSGQAVTTEDMLRKQMHNVGELYFLTSNFFPFSNDTAAFLSFFFPPFTHSFQYTWCMFRNTDSDLLLAGIARSLKFNAHFTTALLTLTEKKKKNQ